MTLSTADAVLASLRRIREATSYTNEVLPGTEDAGRAWCDAARAGDIGELARAEDAVLKAWAVAYLRRSA
jgi:hypothetical protein